MKKLLFLIAIAAFVCKAIASDKNNSSEIEKASPPPAAPQSDTPQSSSF
jgi:hypothetical protein